LGGDLKTLDWSFIEFKEPMTILYVKNSSLSNYVHVIF
jgi:hypothetical protein